MHISQAPYKRTRECCGDLHPHLAILQQVQGQSDNQQKKHNCINKMQIETSEKIYLQYNPAGIQPEPQRTRILENIPNSRK